MAKDDDIVAQRFAHRLSKQFKPEHVPAQSMTESALLRIASATEYAAGQLFLIRQVLENGPAKVDGGEN